MTTIEETTTIPIIDISPWIKLYELSSSSNLMNGDNYRTETNTSNTSDVNDNGTTIPDCTTQKQQEQLLLEKECMNIVNKINDACCRIGFFVIIGHGIKESIIDNVLYESKQFFDLSTEIKLQSKTSNEIEYPYGYENNESLQLGKQPSSSQQHRADLKETFSIGPYNILSGMPLRRFNSHCHTKEFQNALEEYYIQMEQLSLILMNIFSIALNLSTINDNNHWFDDKLNHHCSALRILNYYPLSLSSNNNDDNNNYHEGNNVRIRASSHTDYGALTILKSCGPGLQVRKDNNSNNSDNDKWIDVPVLENAFIINLGDLMPRWTNDQWVSTLHRVIVPPTTSTKQDNNNNNDTGMIVERRQSIAYFCNVNGDTIIETIPTCYNDTNNPTKYPTPITAIEHLMSKHLASMSIAS